ncbi:MAG: Gfo/Idh/MocA family protein [Verrucomicrobiia bacterium]
MISHTNRRGFLKRALGICLSAGALPQIVSPSVLGANGEVSPSNRITLGFIGTGDHGINRNINGFIRHKDAMIVAVCDVDKSRREQAKKFVEDRYSQQLKDAQYKGCDAYSDFREIINRKDIDAVMISTPDHWHVIPAIMAVKAGKDVICEKPLTLTVNEGRVLSNAVKKYNRIFQTSSENRSQEIKHYHRIVELVRNGRIGKLKRILVELPTGYSIRPAAKEFTNPPEGFDYDMWLGQAPFAPYCEARCHWNFRWNLDYSGGMLTDWGAHLIDIAQWGNDTELTGPVEIEGKGDFPPKSELYNAAKTFNITCKYANGVELNIVSNRPGIRFEGTDGWIGNAGWAAKPQAEPASILDSQIGEEEIHLYTAPDEHRNFLDCVKSRKQCYAPAEIGHRTITIAHIGNIAMMLGRKLKWNPIEEKFVNDETANQMLDRPRRKPWTLPEV